MEPIVWTTMEFTEKERHTDWVWYAGLIALVVAIGSFLLHNLFFGIFAIIAGATVIYMAGHKPKELTISIEEKGIQVNEEFFAYTAIKQFWLDESQKPDKILILVPGIAPLRAYHIEGPETEAIRAALTGKIALEAPLQESFGTRFLERLGF
jgi:hypothetical protein